MKLVSYYSNPSVKHENSTCLDFVPVQVKQFEKGHFSLMQEKNKNVFSTKWHTSGL